MPFGISPAPECFKRKLDQNREGLEGIYKVADDILITVRGKSQEEAVKNHDVNLLKLLDRCRERNLKLNREKLQLKCTETPFIGHVLTSEGIKPDPGKIEAVLKMERSSDVAAARRLVGLVKYFSKFLSKLSELCEPLRRLTHKGVEWSWPIEQVKAFESVKQAVTSAPILRYFNSNDPVEGQGDASANGIGFALMQNGQPYPFLVGPSPNVRGTILNLRKNCWHKSLELSAIIIMFMAGKLYCGQIINLWRLSLRSPQKQPLNACKGRFYDCSNMLSRSVTSLVLKCFWQTLCHVPIY